MDNARDGYNEVGIWSSKHYLIVADVSILLNVMLIFRKVLTKTVKNPILVNWTFTRRNGSEHYCPGSPGNSMDRMPGTSCR